MMTEIATDEVEVLLESTTEIVDVTAILLRETIAILTGVNTFLQIRVLLMIIEVLHIFEINVS